MVRLKWLAALAAAFALCAPASAQKIWGLPPSGPLAGTEQIPATSGAGCATQTLPCKMVSVTPSQLASYLSPGFQPADADLSAIAALSTTPFGRSLLTLTDPPTARSVLGIAIGSNVEAWDADLDGLAAATASNAIYYRAAPGSWQAVALGPNFSFANGNLTIPGLPIIVTGDASGATTSASGGLALTLATVNSSPGSYGGPLSISTFTTNAKGQVTASGAVALGTVPIGQGGTGATTASAAVAAIGAQPTSSILSAMAGLSLGADTCVYWTGASAASPYSCPSYGRGLMGSTSASAALSTLGVSATGTDPNFAKLSGATFTGAVTVGSIVLSTNSSNIGIGQGALGAAITSAANNVAVGQSALAGLTTGTYNMALGGTAGTSITTGYYNTLMGVGASKSLTTGYYNVGVGASAGYSNVSGYYNTNVGTNAGYGGTGNGNTMIGGNAGNNVTTGSNNTIIGRYSGGAGINNWVAIADGAGTTRFLWDGNNVNLTGPVLGSSTVAGTVLQATAATTVANLPTCNAAARGTHSVVTDAASPTFLGSLTGGGSVVAPVFCNGSGWVAG